MITPLPLQGNVIYGGRWSGRTIKDVIQMGSYSVEQTRGAWPYDETGEIEWGLTKAEYQSVLAEFRSKGMCGIYSYDHEFEGEIYIRPVGGWDYEETFADWDMILTMSFRRVLA